MNITGKLLAICTLVISNSIFASEFLVQKKYGGIANKPADYLSIDGQVSKLVPISQYNSYLAQQAGISQKPANHIMLNKTDEVVVQPYVIVPESEYLDYIKKHNGYAGKPANHVRVNGLETIIMSSKDINTNLSLYPGLATKPANHVVIDGQEIIFIQKEKYRNFIGFHAGVPGMPSNYVHIDNKIVVVVPINPQDVADISHVPIPQDISDIGKNTIKNVPVENNTNLNNKASGATVISR